jgi:hypothetical protein
MPKLRPDPSVTYGFRAETDERLRQGDHQVVKVTYTDLRGETRKVGNLILPDHLIAEFLARFD